MPMPVVTVKMRKNGVQVASFRDEAGRRVRTSAGEVDWERADLVRAVGEYGMQLQLDQAAAGVGSDGTEMPRLKGSWRAEFKIRQGGRASFVRIAYASRKGRHGAKPWRDLRFTGGMLDGIRMTYLDSKTMTFGITTRLGRVKAQANEKRAPWWGWSPQSMTKLSEYAADVFPQSVAQNLVRLGLAGASVLSVGGRKVLLRRAA